MKKISILLALVLILSSFSSCKRADENQNEGMDLAGLDKQAKGITLKVVTSFSGDDGNRASYEKAYKAYEQISGNMVKDVSGSSSEEWKAKIMADFETGAEPDVLFYFVGVDSDKIIEKNKVISIEEIRSLYPDYAENMRDGLLPLSTYDNKAYAVPVNGYWEGLYVNKKILEKAGVKIPGADYTWEQFLKDCEKIKQEGFVPIAASLHDLPHYWFEFAVYNNSTTKMHTSIPANARDSAGRAWVAGLNDIKQLYELGYFPENTNMALDGETFQLLLDDKAAFAIDGSWKLGWLKENVPDPENFTVKYVPAKGNRKATDTVGGLSMGYYITRKAWEDPDIKDAAVNFVSHMTSDEVINTFDYTATTALKQGVYPPGQVSELEYDAIAMVNGITSVEPAVQDGLKGNARGALFANIKNVATGTLSPEEAINEALAKLEEE